MATHDSSWTRDAAPASKPTTAARSDHSPPPAADDDAAALARQHPAQPHQLHGILRGFGACFVSMVVHLLGLIVLALCFIPANVRTEVRTIVSSMFQEREEELQEVELEEEIEAATEMSVAVFSSAPLAGAQGSVSGSNAPPQLDQKVVEQFATTTSEIHVDAPTVDLPNSERLIEEVPDGALGDPRAIVDDYAQAMDRITQEIMWMLHRGDVLVIWCFDQSESMKDDQEEIRQRIDRVYTELGLSSASTGDHLLTAVTSYGAGFQVHTRKPTSDRDEIRQAIASVPVDPSGKEMMCEAVGRSIERHREYAKTRQIALILVTDESGERPNNNMYLERAIAEAKSARAKLYVLGREACFGYPFVHMRWRHPQTKRMHWLPVDRGPETAFVEQLQTNGFRRRYDAFGSGFAPYEEARMTRETGGIFFMLPSVESAIVRGEKRRYELEAMRAYRPDLRARIEVVADRDKYPLRTLIWKVVNDLSPYSKQAAQVVEMRVTFSRDPVQLQRQARQEQQKAVLYLQYLAAAEQALEEGQLHRQQEADPRWQANYDLIQAQVVAYQARIYEYGATLEAFIQKPKVVPLTKSPNLQFVHWDITTRQQTLTEESKPYIERSSGLFQEVMQNHPGTPWAARAQWELDRGFGVDLIPDYEPPYPKVSNPIPVPKL